MKPIGRSQGKGIFLFNKLSEIQEWKTAYRQRNKPNQGGGPDEKEEPRKKVQVYVVQAYLERPYLVGA